MNLKARIKLTAIIVMLSTLTITAQNQAPIVSNATTQANNDTTGGSRDCPGTVTYAGKTYNTVQIGDQCWFKESLDVGTRIKGVDNQTNNAIIEKYCYDNDSGNCDSYGALYQWDEAMQYVTTEGAQGICPPGWHIPTSEELQTLINVVGSSSKALKAIGQGIGSSAGTNTSGYSALLAGFRHFYDGSFRSLDYYIDFWSSTENGSLAKGIYMSSIYDDVHFYYNRKDNGFCVRCLKD